ncbi:hypothetical protein ABET41_12455 [Metabacillus fastidiosus]|uniref:Uncharacterized protein n=1 Tax=Metabacillus fastidiosus TaxID=1458 RepID=A0ABU6P250_9BACI|nr:hypothetical protein [Metabacillus fastidiosus]MED4402221.1 hypothetical protein [Metabacillus fastidiosus]MED4455705.1 hypothetical protein [Metabacillus fastidiosus]MED4462090.1 hypothetical protein [Metabacillus fastidiosus]
MKNQNVGFGITGNSSTKQQATSDLSSNNKVKEPVQLRDGDPARSPDGSKHGVDLG